MATSSAPSALNATTLTICSLGFFLGLLHIFLGLVGIFPSIHQDYHRDLKSNFNAYARNFQFIGHLVNQATLALYLRHLFAVAKILFGLFLVENGLLKTNFGKLGNYGLLLVNIKLLLLQLSVRSPLERIAPTCVFTVLLLARLVIIMQSTKKVKVAAGGKSKSSGKPKTSTPRKNKNE